MRVSNAKRSPCRRAPVRGNELLHARARAHRPRKFRRNGISRAIKTHSGRMMYFSAHNGATSLNNARLGKWPRDENETAARASVGEMVSFAFARLNTRGMSLDARARSHEHEIRNVNLNISLYSPDIISPFGPHDWQSR